MDGSAIVNVLVQVTAAVFLAAPTAALAQNGYPSRAVKIVIPVPPGNNTEALLRVVAEKLALRWGKPVLVENKPGANQTLGAEAVAKAEPDGYTLLASLPGPIATARTLYSQLAYDPAEFVPVTVLATLVHLIVVNPRVPVTSVQELIAYAKANPDKLSYGSSGNGGVPHLATEMLKLDAGIRMVHVPYKGLAPAMADLLGGRIDLIFDNVTNTRSYIRDGRLRAIGVGSLKRIPEFPGVPAVAELFPGFEAIAWLCVVAPPKTPAEIAAKISMAMADTLKMPGVAARFEELSAQPVGSSPADTAAFLRKETERWRNVIVSAGIKPD
jgi:tripartite-type tricarboxylate transporter receptor subunit TctC